MGNVNLSWYYANGYVYSNVDPEGNYQEGLDWTDARIWSGYNTGDTALTAYTFDGSTVYSGNPEITYYTSDGTKYSKKLAGDKLGATRWYGQKGALIVDQQSSDIIIDGLNIVNSSPVMVTQGKKMHI